MPRSRFGFLSAPKNLSPQERKGIADQRRTLNAMLKTVEFAVATQSTAAASPSFDRVIEVARAYIERHVQHHVKVEEFLGTREADGELSPKIREKLMALTQYNEILAANWVIARTAFTRLPRGARE